MSAISDRIALWIWRDLSIRAGFREVCDQNQSGSMQTGNPMIVDFWSARIEEEIGDNRFIAALEKIRDIRGTRHESSYIAARALGPRGDEQAAAAGITQYAAPDGVHVVQQDLFAPTHEVKAAPAAAAPVAGPVPATEPVEEIADI